MVNDGEVAEVILPTLEGQIGVESHHMPLVSVATTGVIAVRLNPKDRDDARDYFATCQGIVYKKRYTNSVFSQDFCFQRR